MDRHQVDPGHYRSGYDTEGRMFSYCAQIAAVQRLMPASVLEIGVGSGFVSGFLKSNGFDVTTLDIDERLAPDRCGSILEIPFADGSFDLVTAFQVLEHIRYQDALSALSEVHRVSSKNAVLSLPDCTRTLRLGVQLPKLRPLRLMITQPRLRRPVHEFNGEHYWEIGKAGYPLSRIRADIIRAGFRLIDSYRVFEYPYHRFFLMERH